MGDLWATIHEWDVWFATTFVAEVCLLARALLAVAVARVRKSERARSCGCALTFAVRWPRRSAYQYDETSTHYLATATPELPLTAVAIYLAMVFFLPKILPPLSSAEHAARKKQPKSLFDTLLAIVVPCWDLGLSLFSFAVLFGVGLPYYRDIQVRALALSLSLSLSLSLDAVLAASSLLSPASCAYLQTHGFVNMFCDEKFVIHLHSTPLKFWSYLFALSKYYELADTLFLILKRKPVIFLHWYHHTTVLLFTWFAEVRANDLLSPLSIALAHFVELTRSFAVSLFRSTGASRWLSCSSW